MLTVLGIVLHPVSEPLVDGGHAEPLRGLGLNVQSEPAGREFSVHGEKVIESKDHERQGFTPTPCRRVVFPCNEGHHLPALDSDIRFMFASGLRIASSYRPSGFKRCSYGTFPLRAVLFRRCSTSHAPCTVAWRECSPKRE